jgi:glycosyltransferase involved in cell wall biosynthesis
MLSAHYVRQWDYLAAQRVDAFAANSRYIQDLIRKYYRRDSTIIFPPVDTSEGYVTESHGDYYLTVARLVDVKRMDLLIEAWNRLGRHLVIVGRGPSESALRAMPGQLFRSEDTLLMGSCATYMRDRRRCSLLLKEDYGRPVIAYGRGGAMESVVGGFSPELQRDGRATGALAGVGLQRIGWGRRRCRAGKFRS